MPLGAFCCPLAAEGCRERFAAPFGGEKAGKRKASGTTNCGTDKLPSCFEAIAYLFLGPAPLGVSGEGWDGRCPRQIEGFGPVPTRIRGAEYLLFAYWP